MTLVQVLRADFQAMPACYRAGSRGDWPMQAVYYERNGAAREVLTVGEVQTPRPRAR